MQNHKNKKRKQRIHDEAETPCKVPRTDSAEKAEETKTGEDETSLEQREDETSLEQRDSQSEDFQVGTPWKNLQLILCTRNKHLDLQRKVEAAFNFVHSRVEYGDDTDQDRETIKLPRLLCFLNDWIQSLLISPDKKIPCDEKKPHVEGIEAYMDLRCWEIFKFCLQESLKFHVSLNMSRNLLRPIQFIARNALSLLEDSCICSGELFIPDERYKLYDTALDCVSLVFSSHGGLSKENLDLWVSTASVGLELVLKMYTKNLDGDNIGCFALRFLCLVLQRFSQFLKAHPAKKNGFYEFLDKLLEPLLHLSGELRLRVNGSNPIWTGRLMNVVEDVISHGLFHPVHIDGFLSLHGSEKYVASCDDKSKDSKVAIKSYHRHLFDVLNKIITRKNTMAMGSIGLLFQLFVNLARKFKGSAAWYEGNTTMEKMKDLRQPVAAENCSSNNMCGDIQKSFFNFFVLIMEPLLIKVAAYLQAKIDAKLLLSDFHGILKSIGNLLASFKQEKVYVRTEDTSGGACLNFLKKIFNTLMSSSTSLLCLPNCDTNNRIEMEIFTSSTNETLVAMGYLLEIEYEVTGEDLANLWLIMLSCFAINYNLVNVFEQCSLSSSIPALGCQIINLYCQLRQVKTSILALCKAIRLIISHEGNTDEGSSRFLTSLPDDVYSESVERLLSSQKFILAIYKAVQSIPEGQVSGCIRQITDDISESLRWMKDYSSLVDREKMRIFNLKVELLGRGLSRLYCLVLDSVIVTEGNSSLLGVAVKELMAPMRPYLSTLVGQQLDTICRFLSSVLGETVDMVIGKRKVLKKFGRSSQWVLVFFFQLFVSCRSLHRQTISLMPPGLSKKMSAEVGDYTSYSACELMDKIDEIDSGYFSWLVQPSASLLVVMEFISDVYLQYGSADCCPLIYIFHSMALQRLVDLNRLIVFFTYLQKNHYRSRIKSLEEEATGLTSFMMENLSCVYESPIFISDDVACEDIILLAPQSDGWNQGVYVASKNSLPTAIWSNLCKNVDIWGNHASKKQLKKFFSHLLRTSLHRVRCSFQELGVHEITECKLLKRVTLPQISSELLSNTLLYEQKFAHRNLASTFCCALEKSVLPLFSNIACTDVNLRASPNWLEFLSALDNSAPVVDVSKEVPVDCSEVGRPIPHSCDTLPADISREEKTFPPTKENFAVCHRLLNLLRWMPLINARSFSRHVTCIFNLERLIITALLNFRSTMYQDFYCEYLRLFVSCRKSLRYLIMGFCQKIDAIPSSPISIISESSFPVLWISKSVSVVVGIKEAVPAETSVLFRSLIFSLMDHTSFVLLGIGKYQIIHQFPVDKEVEKPCEEISNNRISDEDNHLLPFSQHVDFPKLEALKSLTFMSENLKEHMQNLLVSLKDAPCCVNLESGITYENINRLSSAVSCFSGFLWGLTTVMGQTDAKGSDHIEKVLMWKSEHASELNVCTFSLVELIDFIIHKLLVESSISKADASSGKQQESKAAATCSTSSAIDNGFKGTCAPERMLNPECENAVANVLARANSLQPRGLNKPLLQSLLEGEHPEVAFLLRQLLIGSSSLLRLNLQNDISSLLSSFVPTLIEISQVLLLKFTEMVEFPSLSAFQLLDGALSYLKELASYFPSTDPSSSRELYTKLVRFHMRAIGKTILLQGKRATLTFHERQSSVKTLHKGSIEACSSSGLYSFCLDEFKARLRVSFKAYIERPSELHLLSTIQAIERALVGVQDGCTMTYDIKTSKDGGSISSLVAAGIDCFDMILEFVSGRKGLKLIKRHCQSLVAAVFNIIVHLQSPNIFYVEFTSVTIANNPDPGSAILMCVEVLVTVSRKHALFPMDSWHLGHLLHIPAALFQNFHQLTISKALGPSDPLTISEEQICHSVETVDCCHVDHQFSINLFVACCQLLCTTIRHRPSECKQCVSHLEASVAVLLNCLETVLENESTLHKGCFSWKLEQGVKCACFFRRIYEEIKQQKEIFGRQCSLFLSNYIWVYSGYGPKRSGIRREIDEALRPGVYALIDACSVDDLQYLHTVFGEGPCRNTLASLQHDYKLNFQYEGKV